MAVVAALMLCAGMTNVSKFLCMYVVFQKNETNPQSFFVSVFGILFVLVPAQIPMRWTWLVFSMTHLIK